MEDASDVSCCGQASYYVPSEPVYERLAGRGVGLLLLRLYREWLVRTKL